MTRDAKELLTDDELVRAFNKTNGAKNTYQATFVPDEEDNLVSNWDIQLFTANSKPEAVKIAREYGYRIINKRMVYVYREWPLPQPK